MSLVALGSFVVSTKVAAAVSPPKVAIDTVVTTTLAVFEFNTFFSPAAVVISSEIDHNFKNPAAPPLNEAYCMSTTTTFTHHVTLSTTGVVTKCVGASCGSNPG